VIGFCLKEVAISFQRAGSVGTTQSCFINFFLQY